MLGFVHRIDFDRAFILHKLTLSGSYRSAKKKIMKKNTKLSELEN